jgi:hypothetical protein
VRYVFTDARAGTAFPDWDSVADRQVAALRFGPESDPQVARLVDELTVVAGAPFSERYAKPLDVPENAGVERFHHPDVGALRLAYETLELPDAYQLQLVVYLPADDATAKALDRLAGRRPGALRAVNG